VYIIRWAVNFCFDSYRFKNENSFPRIKLECHVVWGEHVACVEQMNAYKILVVKPEGKRLLGRPGHWILWK
jgi:hypothetical protein